MPVTNRLDFFRKEMAAFAGAAFPQQAISDGYYILEPRKSVSEVITGRIALRPASSHLLLGGIGSGKTTQLLMTRDRIELEVNDTKAIYIDVSDYTDITIASPGVLITIIGLSFIDMIESHDSTDLEEDIRKIYELAYGYFEDDYILTPSYIPGILKPESSELQTRVKAIKTIRECIISEEQKIVFLIDGLDRLNDPKSFLNMIINDVHKIATLQVGVVIAGALHNTYDNSFSEAKKVFNYSINQPCFDIEEDVESRDFFRRVISGRSSPGFIDESASSKLIHYSGGILRDLISLTELAIEEAYISDDGDTVTLEHVEIAAENSASMKLLDVSYEDMEILSKVATGNSFMPRGAEQLRLIANSNIIEYTYPKRRYAVHPCLRKYLSTGSSS